MIDREELIKDMEYCMAQWECFRCPKAFKDGKYVCNESEKGVVFIPASFVKNAIKLLKEQPEIVRCKDCKNWIAGYITDQDDFIPPKCGKYQQMAGHSSDDFCSLAERL